MDLYSRKITAWEIWLEESSENASILVRRGVLSEQRSVSVKPLVLHSDNGSPMKGSSLLETLYQLGITPSRSRPRVSNDNPYAESIFRTCKYRPNYPLSGFKDITQARTWVLAFVKWYNQEHRHSGLNFLTPHQRHSGMDKVIFENRRKLYEKAKAAHPERWSRGIRNWTLIMKCGSTRSAFNLKSMRKYSPLNLYTILELNDNYLDIYRLNRRELCHKR